MAHVAAPQETPFPIPAERYQVQEVIESGMTLFKARAYDQQAERQVFIKAEDPANRSAVTRLMREAEMYESLHHDRIPALLEAENGDDSAYIVTEFMPGSRSLPDRLKQGGAKPTFAAKLCLSALEVLQYVHEQGIVHRDIKTSNCLMRTSGEASLTDFGIAMHVGSDEGITGSPLLAEVDTRAAETRITPADSFIGTPSFTAPEQLLGIAVSPKGDIYGIGTMLHQLLDGRLPFFYDDDTTISAQELAMRKTQPNSGHFWQSGRRVPAALKGVVYRALEPNVAARYDSAAAMAEDIERYLAAPEPAKSYVVHNPTAAAESSVTTTETVAVQRIGDAALVAV